MELFLVSNFIITLIVLLYNRYSQASISAKLTLSTFSLLCWVVPFTLIRDYLPQNVAINVYSILPTTTSINLIATESIQSSLWSQLTLIHIFQFSCMTGFLLFLIRIYKHNQWLNKLNKNAQTKLICKHDGIPVYTSSLIDNALLNGYKKPSIWINPTLIDSPYLDIILEHEATHVKHKDNYWLAFITFIKDIYWWNPLLRILVSNIQDYIEARCDHKTSHHFTEGIYHKKLTELIFINMPVSNTGFVSAVVSKNSNIRRLKILKEKQDMNLFSRIFIGLLVASSVAILIFPISTFKAFADNQQQNIINESRKFSVNFDDISIDALSNIVADYFQLEAVVSEVLKTKIVSVKLNQIPDEKALESLSTLLKVKFNIQDGQLLVSPFPEKIDSDDIGVLLDLKIEFFAFNDESKNTKVIESKMWSHFDKTMVMKLDNNWEFEMTVKDSTKNRILIDAKIYLITDSNTRELMSEPKVFTTNGNLASIEIGQSVFKDEKQVSRTPEFRMEITPHKKKYSEINLVKTAQTK